MGTLVRPSGRLPARVYWARRLLLLSLVLLLLWGLVRWVGGVGRPGTVAVTPPASTTPTTPTAARTRHRSHTHRFVPGVRPVTTVLSTANRRCDPATVHVYPAVPSPAQVGAETSVQLRVSSTATSACRLDLSAASLLVAVSSKDATVWTSSQCPAAIASQTLSLQPHWGVVVPVPWSGLFSRQGCSPSAPAAPPGSYTVQAALLQGEPGTTDFRLKPAPKPRPKAKPKHRPHT